MEIASVGPVGRKEAPNNVQYYYNLSVHKYDRGRWSPRGAMIPSSETHNCSRGWGPLGSDGGTRNNNIVTAMIKIIKQYAHTRSAHTCARPYTATVTMTTMTMPHAVCLYVGRDRLLPPLCPRRDSYGTVLCVAAASRTSSWTVAGWAAAAAAVAAASVVRTQVHLLPRRPSSAIVRWLVGVLIGTAAVIPEEDDSGGAHVKSSMGRTRSLFFLYTYKRPGSVRRVVSWILRRC